MKKFLLSLCARGLCVGGVFATGPTYSPAAVAGDTIYVSAQLPIDPNTGQLIQGNMQTLTTFVLNQMKHWLTVKGFTLNNVTKTVVYLTDIREYSQMDHAYSQFFPMQYPPARDVLEAAALPNNATIQISCTASKLRG